MSRRRQSTVLDDATKGQILALAAMGLSRAVAARHVGCSEGALRNAVRNDAQFARALRRAKDAPELSYLTRIRKASEETKNWRAAAWALERGRPQRYARRRPETFTLAQMRHFVSLLCEAVIQEVPERMRSRLLDRLEPLIGEFLSGQRKGGQDHGR